MLHRCAAYLATLNTVAKTVPKPGEDCGTAKTTKNVRSRQVHAGSDSLSLIPSPACKAAMLSMQALLNAPQVHEWIRR